MEAEVAVEVVAVAASVYSALEAAAVVALIELLSTFLLITFLTSSAPRNRSKGLRLILTD